MNCKQSRSQQGTESGLFPFFKKLKTQKINQEGIQRVGQEGEAMVPDKVIPFEMPDNQEREVKKWTVIIPDPICHHRMSPGFEESL
jgi:hypothetical protein